MTNFFEEKERKLASTYRAGLYCRLSKADGEGESASIANQRTMLTAFCEKKGWRVSKIYEDDGFSGLKANRPKLQELMADVETGQINVVITKDYSRLGRDRLNTEDLRERFFPKHNCRYIAILDGYDSLYNDTEDIMPFKSILNEMYSKDIGKKVHAAYKSHAEQGLYTGTVPPLGYLKDPMKKGHLIIDEETAPIIKQIFKMALQGHGPNHICRRLEEAKIPCPTYWNRQRGFRSTITKYEAKDPINGKYVWDFSVVKTILQNPVYTGTISSQKTEYRFKIGVVADKPSDEWITVLDCHDALISKDDFEAVQASLRGRKRAGANGEYSLFAGLLKCGECGKSMNLKYSNSKSRTRFYSCKTYDTHGKKHCSQHRIEYDLLYNAVLEDIRKLISEALSDDEEVTSEMSSRYNAKKQKQVEAIKKQMQTAKSKIEMADNKLLKLYEDNLEGKITDEMLNRLTDKIQQEEKQLTDTLADLQRALITEQEGKKQHSEFLKVIQEYRDIKELTPEILHKLINSIVIHETITDGKKSITIEINYRVKPC